MRKADWSRRRSDEAPAEITGRFGQLRGQVLWQRGLTDPAEVERYLEPRLETLTSPFRIKNLEESARRVAGAILRDEPVVVYSDYDIDGMSGLAILVSFFDSIGFRHVKPYQPSRLEEGYGVHAEAVRNLAQAGAKVIITVDSGITAFDAVNEAKRHGVDVVITDHHQASPSGLPDTPYIVNPNQKACTSGLTYLSGAAVAFYLAMGVRSVLRQQGYFTGARKEPDLRELLDLLVLGTVADSVELRGDNRVLVRAGLKRLAFSRRPGLRLLLARCLTREGELTARDVGFSIAPKLNAASRMGKAHLSTELLLTQDIERAQALVEELMQLNEQRSRIQGTVFDAALDQAKNQMRDKDPPVLVVHGDDWHEGVLGVVAAKLVEKLGRPSIVLTKARDELMRGSMRTLPRVHCLKLLDSCKEVLNRYGGHKAAAGLQLGADRVLDFSDRIWNAATAAGSQLFELDPVAFDGDLPAGLTLREVLDLDSLAPWGMGNPEPLFRLAKLDLSKKSVMKNAHFKCRLSDGLEVVAFNKNDAAEEILASGSEAEALVVPEINRFRGNQTIQLRLEHLRPRPADSPGP
jgi:single-stranded-DNA-specific exonuclease